MLSNLLIDTLTRFTDLIKKLIIMCMDAKKLEADWQSLHVVLDRCYEGPPAGKCGTFTGTVLTICQLLEGWVVMEKEGVRLESRCDNNEWIVCIPGERYQEFSDASRIISVHLAIRNPGNGAEWRGIPIVKFTPSEACRNALTRLRESRAFEQITQEQSLSIFGVVMTLDHAIEIQENLLGFFRQLLCQLRQHGMCFEVPFIHEERVRRSHKYLAGLDVRESFSREQIACSVGLTPGQLDRLWRSEMGITPRQYWNRKRIAYACEQLRRYEPSIKSVASDLGFRHLSQFSNWFCKYQGESPRTFRNRPQSP